MKTSVFYVIDFDGFFTPANCHRYYFNLAEAIQEANNSFNEFIDDFCSSHDSTVVNDFVNDVLGYFRQIVIRHSDGYCNIITLSIHRKEFLVK